MADKEYIPETDVGRERVDDDLKDLEKRIAKSYEDAAKDITTDLDTFMQRYETLDEKKREEVEDGTLSEKDYKDWKKRQIFRSNAMQAKIDDLSERMVHADQQAMAMVNKELPEVYATSYNYGGYRGETYANAAGFDYTQFTVVNEDAVRILMTEDPDLIPWKPDVDVEKDKQWNRKHIQNAVQQGIIKGDGMDKIAKRLLPVVNMDKNAAIRTARTAVNGVENKGRQDATQRVREAGIPMVEVWSATHDSRTRSSHILMDGETRGEDGLFSNGLEYPAEPNGNVDGSEIYNCRCRLNSYIEGIDHSQDDELYAKFMEDNYYDDWYGQKNEEGEYVGGVKQDREKKEAQFQKGKLKAEDKREHIEKKWAENKEKRFANEKEKGIISGNKEEKEVATMKPAEKTYGSEAWRESDPKFQKQTSGGVYFWNDPNPVYGQVIDDKYYERLPEYAKKSVVSLSSTDTWDGKHMKMHYIDKDGKIQYLDEYGVSDFMYGVKQQKDQMGNMQEFDYDGKFSEGKDLEKKKYDPDEWWAGMPTVSGTIAETGEKVKMVNNGYWVGAGGKHISSYIRADGKDPDHQYSMDRKHRFWLEAIG